MEEQREESEFVGDCSEPMEEAGKGLGLSSKTETLDGEDRNTVEVSDSGVGDVSAIDVNPNDGVSATVDGNTDNLVSDEKQVKADVENVEDTGEETKDNVDDVALTDAITEPEIERNDMECDGDAGTVEVKPVDDMQRVSETVKLVEVEMNGETAKSEVKSKHGQSHESAGEGERVISGGNEVTDEKAKCEVEDNGDACDVEQNVHIEKSQQSSVDAEMLSVAEKKGDQEKESTKKIEEDNKKMGVDSKQEKASHSYNEQGNSGCETSYADQEKESAKKSEADNKKRNVDSKQENEENVGLNEQRNPGSETKDAKHSESAIVPEESIQLSKRETKEVNPGTVSEVSSAAEINDEGKITNVKVGGALDSACNESAGSSVVRTQDIPIAEADVNNSNVVNEMEIDEQKDNTDMASDLTKTIVSADLANPNSPSEDAAPGEVEPLDHNALFDPTSDITNFIDFSGVSSWSGNIQDLKTDTRNVSLKEDKKAADMAEEVATVGFESSEARVGSGAQSPAAATDCSKEASDAILGSEKNQEDKDHECLDKKTADQQDTMREEEDITHEAPSIDPNQKEDTEKEENPNNSDYADDEAGSDIKTNGVKRKADVLSEDSPGEGRKTVSLAKVSFAQRPSFKIGACIARAASQMAGSSSVLKGSNFDDETLSVESFVSQLHCAATDPDKEKVVSDIAAGFFLDFRNSSALQHGTPEMVSNKRGRPSNSNVAGTEAFEFEEMGDTYWTDRVIHNGGEEQTQPTEKGNYQVVPVELKPAQVQRTRRPYKRRQAQINIPLSVSDKPANFDENAPAELVMKFSEADTIPPEKSLSKMFRHFGPIRESQTEVDKENNRARVVYRKGADAEVAYNSAGRFSIFGTKEVNYELSYTITETFKVRPYVVSLGEEDAALCLPS